MATEKINILVVDDLPEKRLVLESILEELDENVICARSGQEALAHVLHQDFAVILLDVNMPGMDGLETAALIRKRKKSAHTPIIFITAFADEMHTAQGYSLGAVDYILSPIIPAVLRTKVSVFVELFRMTELAKRQADERVALAHEQAARAVAEEATRRSNFLAEASKIMSSSLDTETTLRGLLRLAVPHLADASAVTLVDEQGHPGRTELYGAGLTPSDAPVVLMPDEMPCHFTDIILRALTIGKPVRVDDPPRMTGPTNVPTEVWPQPGLVPVIVIPLLARGRALGVLTLALQISSRQSTKPDVALAVEVAERAAVAIDNARLYDDVQQADRHKNDFLAMLAHELRNPLAPIRNAVHVLDKFCNHEPQMQIARDIIDRQVHQLIRLVDDLLDISRITRGKIRLQQETVDIAAVVMQAVETCRPLIDSRKHELTVNMPSRPVLVFGDPVRLAQVVGNLLNNAAKYTPEGGKIWLTVESTAAEVVVRVRDSGMGIAAELIGTVFDLFTQADRSLDRSQGGLGIGLTVVRRLLEMHGGRVEVHSEGPNRGSEFVIFIPGLNNSPGSTETANGAAPIQATSGRRVLVVDDNADAADSMAMLLHIAGHEPRVCHDGPSALALAAHFLPELVLLDIGLPGMDGYEVASRLRRIEGLRGTVIAALTGYGQPEDVRRSREAGFDHHLVKPADLSTLSAIVASIDVKANHRVAGPARNA